MRDKGKPGSSPQQITRLWTQQGNWPPTQLQALQQYIFHKFDHFFIIIIIICLYFTKTQ